jgi:hypothetical protein
MEGIKSYVSGDAGFTLMYPYDYRAFPIQRSVALTTQALYPVSVCHHLDFAKNFLQIPGRPGHPCPSLYFLSYRRIGVSHPLV